MKISIPARCRGSVLAIALMALIAIMALMVVFYSRAGREQADPAPVENETTTSAVSSDPAVTTDTVTEVDPADEPAAPAPAATPATVPPPPPPVSTPDARNLPPEG